MNLEKIKDEKCCICGAIVISESKKNQHYNGNWNEERIFKCGKFIRYSPNYDKVDWMGDCENDPVVKEKFEKRKIAKEKIRQYLDQIDVDQDFKNKISQYF